MNTINYSSEEFNGLKVAADWIRDLESSDSRLHKESVIEKALVAARLGSLNAQCFLYNCYLAYNPFYIYNVKQVPETEDLTGRDNPWPAFWGMLEGLRTRSLTGHHARNVIAEMSERFDSVQWNGLCRRVIIKDLRCGISEKTLNKILNKTDWRIPVFSCQLAQDSTDHPAKMTGKKRLEVKLDGVRVIAICYKDGTVNLFSRNGKPFDNFPHIQKQLANYCKELSVAMFKTMPPIDFVLDGEVMGQSFQALMKQARRKTNADASDSVFNVFDVMPRDSFAEGHYNAQQHKRLAMLEFIRNFDMPNVNIMDGIDVDLDTFEGRNQMQRYAEDAIAKGYEGIMIKDVDAPYECKRSSFWMKWKPTITVDLNIIGFEEGTGRNLGRLGAIICEGVDNDRRITVNVGSGLTDSDRDSFWAERDYLLGRVVEVEADVVTQNQDGTYSLRFPRFIRFRDALTGEKE